MIAQIKRRLGRQPKRALVDTQYATQQDIVALAADGIDVYAPPPPDKADALAASQRQRAQRRAREPEAVQEWRRRRADDASKPICQRRARIETTNGILKGRGFGIMRVRSLAKVACVALLQALANNLWRAHRLRAAVA